MNKPRPPRKGTIRQKKFAKLVVQTGDSRAALIQAGYNPSTPESAQVMVSRLLKDGAVNARIEWELEQIQADYKTAVSKKLLELALHNDDPKVNLGAIKEIASWIGLGKSSEVKRVTAKLPAPQQKSLLPEE